ncbi:hypothetical protein [Planctomicrobium sp. SH527]|uniref:hypothetical protein n=1 Tax=Planctomicrobium sp. SH527 TaxID=3448123 RepID=UPI003F5BA2CF
MPGVEERFRIFTDSLDGCLAFGDVSQTLFDLDFLCLQPLQFRLYAYKTFGSEGFEHLDQLCRFAA